jgi:hypothetical protein
MTELKPCKYCGGAKRFQIVSPVSDHAWANCFCTRAAPRTDGDDGELVERLRKMQRAPDGTILPWVVNPDGPEAAARITALSAEVERFNGEREALTGWLAMAVAEMSRARGRLETIATCNEDRRIAAALGRTCDCARRALGAKP